MQLTKSKKHKVSFIFIFSRSPFNFFLRALFYDFLYYCVDKAGLVTDGIYSLPEVAEMCVFLDVGSSYWINSNRKRNGFDWMPIMCQVGYAE